MKTTIIRLLLASQFLTLSALSQTLTPNPSWLKDTLIGEGILVRQLRVPEEEITNKITNPLDRYILNIQHELEWDFQRSKAWNRASTNGVAEIILLRQQAPGWPVEYYQKEYDAYEAYNETIMRHLEKEQASRIAANEEEERLQKLVAGYHFISKPSVIMKESAMDGGRVMGKLYKGCYIKVEDTDELGNALITVGDYTGEIHKSDYVDSLQKLDVTAEEMKELKTQAAYRFEPDPKYTAALKREQEEEARQEKAASASHTSTRKARTYITGPRGGCYYINSNGNKVYVDHSFCH